MKQTILGPILDRFCRYYSGYPGPAPNHKSLGLSNQDYSIKRLKFTSNKGRINNTAKRMVIIFR